MASPEDRFPRPPGKFSKFKKLFRRKSDHQRTENELRSEIQKLQDENDELNKEYEALSSEFRQIQEDNDGMRTEIEELRQKIIKNENEIARLREGGMSSFLVERESVILIKEIGRGGWGVVHKGIFHETDVAVKELHEIIESPHNLKMLQREVNIASQCRHPNLLQFICATKNDQNCLLIVTELMDTTLRSFLEERAVESPPFQALDHEEIKSISLDVARGLNYLHSKKPSPLIHRDISSANVLLMMENGKVKKAKISDYGSANFMDMCNTKNPGAAVYAAPEAGQPQQNTKVDVFSFGILLCEMAICELPDPDNRRNQIEKIPNEKIKLLVKACTKHDPKERPTMEEVFGLWERLFVEYAWHSLPARLSREKLTEGDEKQP